MPAHILDGKTIAQALQNETKAGVQRYQQEHHRSPCLAVILIGADPASKIYVSKKEEACSLVGIESQRHHLSIDCTEATLIQLITSLNQNKLVDGILIQLPLPEHISTNKIINLIDPQKDVDGFHAYNIGRLVQQHPLLRPCTPLAVMKLLEYTKVSLSGQHAVVVGASNVVGKPMGLELLLAGCTVTTCHRQTKNLQDHVEQADILVSAVGHPGLIKGEWIKNGAIVIDVGITRLDNGSIVGDVEFNIAKEKASWITPVPGGVGPMTVVMLMANTLGAAKADLLIRETKFNLF